jgi:asparagine synthase (glutamine-hydrolysing)
MHLIPSKWEYFFKKYFVPELISPPWLNTEKITNNIYPEVFPRSSTTSFIEEESYLQLFFTNLLQLLHYEDRNSMAHSVESRVPFLDYRLLEFVYQLSGEFKIKGETTKIIFRESMRGVLPEKIRTRMDKMGFVTAEEYWVTKENPEFFKQLLKESIEYSQGLLNDSAISQLNAMIEGKELYNQTIWRLICFGRWMKIFNVSL